MRTEEQLRFWEGGWGSLFDKHFEGDTKRTRMY